MRKLFLLVLLLGAGLFLTACSKKEPRLRLEAENLNLGDVVNGDIVTRDLPVYNDGSAPLVVESVSTSCGCTKATLEPMTILPGESAILHIEFDSGAHGPELTGELERQIFIASNDPQQPDAMVSFTSNVLPRP